RPGARRDGRFNPRGIQTPAVLADIDEYRGRPEMYGRRHRGDPVGVGENNLIARPDTERRQAHMQGTGATRSGDGVLDPQVLPEGRLETLDVLVATGPPAVAGSIAHVLHFQFGNGRLGVLDARLHF